MEKLIAMSVNLCQALDFIIGTQKVIDGRRRKRAIDSAFKIHHRYTSIHCGSGAEGFDLPESDLDVMSFDTLVDVIDHGVPLNDRVTFRMIYDVHHPGSVLLEPAFYSIDLPNQCINYKGRVTFSSELYKLGIISHANQPSMTPTGPCVGVPGISTDLCFAYKCSEWPRLAYEFIHRKRKYGWPSSKVLADIVNDGCYCVPIGDGTSNHSWLQWRVSFAPAEVKLVHTFSKLELNVYALMKICYQDILKTIIDYRDGQPLLCSYFLKTVIFIMKENTPSSVWTNTNLVGCFWMCFNFLIDSVEKGFLCHFFIPGSNLFRKRIYGKNRKNLLQFLYKLRRKGPSFLYECPTLHPFRKQSLYITPIVEEMMFNGEVFLFERISLTYEYDMNMMARTLHALTYSHNDVDLFSWFSFIRLILFFKTSELLTSMTETVLNNKTMYYRRRQCRRYLLFTTNLDVSQGWLTLATYHYLLGQYKQAMTICRHVKMSFKPWTTINGVCTNSFAYMSKFCGQEMPILRKMKEVFSNLYMASHKNQQTYPAEISPEINNVDINMPVFIQPKPYATFLSFLCCYHMNDRSGEQKELLELLALQLDDIQGVISGPPTNCILFNLIGTCYELLADFQSAERNYLASVRREDIYSSAAQVRLSRLRQLMDGHN